MAMRLDDFINTSIKTATRLENWLSNTPEAAKQAIPAVNQAIGIPMGYDATNYAQNPTYKAADVISGFGVGIPVSQAIPNVANLITNPKQEIARREYEYAQLTPEQKHEQLTGMAIGAFGAGIKPIYHGTDKIFKNFDVKKSATGSIWFTDNKKKIEAGEVGASGKGRIIKRFIDDNKLKLAGWKEYDKYTTDELIQMGYDGVKLKDKDQTTYSIFFPEKLNK